MPTEQVTIAYVNPPKPGKKQGSIKTEDGRYFGVWPDKLGGFQKGMTCTIDYEVSTASDGSGRQFYNLKNAYTSLGTPIGGGGPAPQPGLFPHKQAKGGGASTEEMFVMGFLNRCYQGAHDVPDREVLVKQGVDLLYAWRKIFAPAEKQAQVATPTPPLPDDDIPF